MNATEDDNVPLRRSTRSRKPILDETIAAPIIDDDDEEEEDSDDDDDVVVSKPRNVNVRHNNNNNNQPRKSSSLAFRSTNNDDDDDDDSDAEDPSFHGGGDHRRRRRGTNANSPPWTTKKRKSPTKQQSPISNNTKQSPSCASQPPTATTVVRGRTITTTKTNSTATNVTPQQQTSSSKTTTTTLSRRTAIGKSQSKPWKSQQQHGGGKGKLTLAAWSQHILSSSSSSGSNRGDTEPSLFVAIVRSIAGVSTGGNPTNNNNNNNKSKKPRGGGGTNNKNKNPTTTSRTGAPNETEMDAVVSSQYTDAIQTVLQSFFRNLQQLPSQRGKGGGEMSDDATTNVLMIQLYNMIFRSVGGTTLLPLVVVNDDDDQEQQIPLDDMSDEDWTNHIDQIVEEMSNTSNDAITITTKSSMSSVAVASNASTIATPQQDFCTIYTEFWYHFTTMVLTNLHATKSRSDSDDDEEEDENSGNGRFQVELVRQIVSRLIELVNVGVPDIRYAFCIAIYQMGLAILQYTTQLQQKVVPAQRQYNVAKQNKHKTKAITLKNQIDLWKRTITDCEEIVKELIVTTVFTIRYKDTDPTIRTVSMQSLYLYCTIRPDLFLMSFYLKYFGWMMSDKQPTVRIAAIQGLMKPLQHYAVSSNKSNNSISTEPPVDVTMNMTSVISKFLPRIVDCVIDVDTRVQEVAMEFVLLLLRQYDFFNDIDNERIWNQINVRALDPTTSPRVRKDALYFVLEQLPVDVATTSSSGKSTTSNLSELDVVTHLYAIGKWVAHTLSDSKIPVSEIRYNLVDYVVMSLRDMPEYKHFVTHQWDAMLRCVLHGDEQHSRKSRKSDNRINNVTQRVMIRMLVTAVQFEVMHIGNQSTGKDKGSSMARLDDDDTEFLDAQRNALIEKFQSATTTITILKKSATANVDKSHEEVTMSLLRELPTLFAVFKSETAILQSLTTLPRYFLPNILNLSSRKKEVQSLLSNLSIIYNEVTDPIVLKNCCQALVFCAKACHARSDMAILTIGKLWKGVLTRLMSLLKTKSNQTSSMDHKDEDDIDTEDSTSSLNVESSIRLCLLRLSILIKRWRCMGGVLDDASSNDEDQLEEVTSAVTEYLISELQSRQYKVDTANDDDASNDDEESLKIWSSVDDNVHRAVAKSVSDGFDFMLACIGWRMHDEIKRIDSGYDTDLSPEEIEGHVVLRIRRRIEKLISICYNQFLPPEMLEKSTEVHQMFSIQVQESALRVSGDIRIQFPRKWSLAKSRLLKALAIDDDVILVGGGYRFIRSQEWRLKIHEDTVLSKQQKHDAVHRILIPVARALGANWETGSRKEAGAALLHITGSGKEASDVVQCLFRVLKKLNPVRLMEAQMACLRQKFEEWAEDEPEEPGDRPTDAEMQEYEEHEQLHRDKFDSLVTMAARFVSSLGVGKIRDKILNPAILGFVREGVRFSFSTELKGSDDPLPLGCRLVFLSILTKYLTWIRPNKEYKLVLRNDFNAYEAALRSHSEYSDVYEEDLKCLVDFRKAGELGEYINVDGETGTYGTSKTAPSTYEPTILRARTSLGSSVSSIRSKATGSLASIHEEDSIQNDDDETDGVDEETDGDISSGATPSPRKRSRTVYSARTQSSVASTVGPIFDDITEGSDTADSSTM